MVGTSGDDTFNIITGTGATLNEFDTIEGGAGNDTANIVSDDGTLPTAAQISGVEAIQIETSAGTPAYDISDLDDVKTLAIGGAAASIGATLGAGQSITIGDAADAFDLTVDAEETDTTVTLDDASGALELTLIGAANTTLTVNGAMAAGNGDLRVETALTTETLNLGLTEDGTITIVNGGALTAVDASTSSADLTIDLATVAVAGVETLIGGMGNDTLDGGPDTTLISGGDGDDILTGGAASELIGGGAGDDTINAGDVADEVINGGAGQDDITLGVGGNMQTVVTDAGESGITLATVDTIFGFVSGEDLLDFNLVDGEAANFLFDGSAGGFLDGLVNANTAFGSDADLVYVQVSDGTDSWVFVDTDGDNAADMAVELTGVGATIAATDIIA